MTWSDVKSKSCPPRCKCNVAHWRQQLESMVDDPDYDYAWTTLEGIFEYVRKHKHITDKQIQAVKNIGNKPSGSSPNLDLFDPLDFHK